MLLHYSIFHVLVSQLSLDWNSVIDFFQRLNTTFQQLRIEVPNYYTV